MQCLVRQAPGWDTPGTPSLMRQPAERLRIEEDRIDAVLTADSPFTATVIDALTGKQTDRLLSAGGNVVPGYVFIGQHIGPRAFR
jgi:hypothetical protein